MTRPCAQFEVRIARLVDQTLPDGEAGTMRAHLASCPDCAAHHEAHLAVARNMSKLRWVRSSPNVAPAVVARIRRRRRAGDAAVLAAILLTKALDLAGMFGSGFQARLIFAAIVIVGLFALRINPFALVRPSESMEAGPLQQKGMPHETA